MILLSIIIYFIFSILLYVPGYGRLSIPKFLQFFFLIILSLNTVIYFILNLFGAINIPLLFLLFQVLSCLLLSVLVIRKKHLTFNDFRINLRGINRELRWFDYTLIAVIGLILTAFFVVGITTPPNNLDSLDPTHLTRVFYWLQAGKFSFFISNAFSMLLDPIVIHLQEVWLFSLGGSENLFFLVQWYSCMVAVATIYQISRLLKFSTTKSLVSTLVGLSFPVALLQIYSSQGDLTVAVLVLISISLGISFFLNKRKIDIFTAILAFVLALGSKRAALMAVPIFGIFILFLIVGTLKHKKWIPWLTGSTGLVVLIIVGYLGHIIYSHGGWIGGIPLLADTSTPVDQIDAKISYNTPRYLYQLIGFDGLPRVTQNMLIQKKADLFKEIFSSNEINLEDQAFLQPGFDQVELFSYTSAPILSEECAWFGPLAFLLLPVALLVSIFSKEKNRRIYAIFCLFLFISFFIMVLLQRPGWDPYQGRYFIVSILPMVPLVSILIPNKKWISYLLWLVIVPVSIFLSMNTFLTNNSKPIITAGTLWGYQYNHILTLPENNKLERYVKNKLVTKFDQIADSALDRQAIYSAPYWTQVYFSSFDRLTDIQFIDPLVPNGEILYLDIPSTGLDYGLFGRNKDRKLIRVNSIDEVDSGYFLTQTASTIIMTNQYQLLGENNSYKVFFVSK